MRVIKLFLGWRLCLFVVVILANYFLPFRPDFTYTHPSYFSALLARPFNKGEVGFNLESWADFDGVHYLAIAGQGYTDQARFLPLYPLTISFATQLLGGAATYSWLQIVVALAISNTAFLASLLVLQKLLLLDGFKQP